MRQWHLSMLLTVATMLLIAADAHANGKYFSKLALDDPTIPSQRAIISWRDGVQTMVIESVVQSSDGNLGWILPLPSVPSAINPATAGTLETMAELITPSMHGTRTRDQWLEGSGFALFFATAISFALFSARFGRTWQMIAVALLFSIVLIGLLTPALAKARSAVPVQGIEIASIARVGSFDVTVIKAVTGDAAKQWLDQNEFSFDARSAAILDDYAKNDWCFAVATIAKEVNTAITPHPLQITFTTKNAIYPMKLTGVTSAPLLLDLFVIGDKRAFASNMKCWFSESFAAVDSAPLHRSKDRFNSVAVGHPHIRSLLWKDCIITRLRATLQPEEMADDIAIRWQDPIAHRHQIYSGKAAIGRAIGVAMLVLAGEILLLSLGYSLTCKGLVKMPIVAAMFAIALASAAMTYAATDVHPMSEDRGARVRLGHYDFVARDYLADWRGMRTSWTTQEFQSDLEEWKRVWWRSDTLPTDMNIDKPSGFTVLESEGDWIITLYDRFAIPTSMQFPKSSDANDASRTATIQ